MTNKTFFPLPEDWVSKWPAMKRPLADLIEALPDGWSWVSGSVVAPPPGDPDRSVTKGYSASGFLVPRFYMSTPNVIGSDEKTEPDFLGLLVGSRLPAFVRFDDAGYEGLVSFPNVRDMAAWYVRLGYRGTLWFYAGGGERRSDAKATCWLDFPNRGDGDRPGILLGWDERYGGKREDIEILREICLKLGLEPHA